MLMKVYFLLASLLAVTTAKIAGKFCGDIIGNPINVSLSKTMANISANVFGSKMNCDYEPYNLTNNHINLRNSKKDCLNSYLTTHGACPCPPNVLYKGDSLVINNTPLGTLVFKSC